MSLESAIGANAALNAGFVLLCKDNAEWVFSENDLKIVTFKVKQTTSGRDSAYASSATTPTGLPSGTYPSPAGQYTVACVMSNRSKKVYLSSEAKGSEFEALSDLKNALEAEVGKKIQKYAGYKLDKAWQIGNA